MTDDGPAAWLEQTPVGRHLVLRLTADEVARLAAGHAVEVSDVDDPLVGKVRADPPVDVVRVTVRRG